MRCTIIYRLNDPLHCEGCYWDCGIDMAMNSQESQTSGCAQDTTQQKLTMMSESREVKPIRVKSDEGDEGTVAWQGHTRSQPTGPSLNAC